VNPTEYSYTLAVANEKSRHWLKQPEGKGCSYWEFSTFKTEQMSELMVFVRQYSIKGKPIGESADRLESARDLWVELTSNHQAVPCENPFYRLNQ
jgi:hypothetical protein